MTATLLATTCTSADIRYHLIEYHTFTVKDDGTVDLDQPDSFNGRIADCRPYTCELHREQFTTWDEAKAHLKQAPRWLARKQAQQPIARHQKLRPRATPYTDQPTQTGEPMNET